MRKGRFLRKSMFFLVIFLVFSSICHPLNILGQEVGPNEMLKIEVKDNLVSVDAKDADLSAVLKEIGRKIGIKMTVNQALVGKNISFYSDKLDVEKVLKEILHDSAYVLTFSQDAVSKKNVLKEVKVLGDVIGSNPYKGKMITIDIPYGSGVGKVGAIDEGEGAMGGPPSFAVDGGGNIYILDPLNRRIQKYSNNGGYLSSIPLETTACDIAIDNESIYIYRCGDGIVKKLYQYNKDGQVIAEIDVDASRWKIYDAPISVVNNNIYIDTCDYNDSCGLFLIGRLSNGKILSKPSSEESRYPIGKKIGLSGKEYTAGVKKGLGGELRIKEKDTGITNIISFPLKNILSLEFFAEDESGNLFVKTDRDNDKDELVEEFHEFSANDEYIETIRMPESNINYRSTKNYILSKDDIIYQFLPEQNKLRLNILPIEDK